VSVPLKKSEANKARLGNPYQPVVSSSVCVTSISTTVSTLALAGRVASA
jgi:hypothetical protein